MTSIVRRLHLGTKRVAACEGAPTALRRWRQVLAIEAWGSILYVHVFSPLTLAGCVYAYATRIARKSLTFVSVGPVTT